MSDAMNGWCHTAAVQQATLIEEALKELPLYKRAKAGEFPLEDLVVVHHRDDSFAARSGAFCRTQPHVFNLSHTVSLRVLCQRCRGERQEFAVDHGSGAYGVRTCSLCDGRGTFADYVEDPDP